MANWLALPLFVAVMSSAQSLDGVWKSEGYGDVYEIRGRELQQFQVTTGTCVLGARAKRLNSEIRGRETFKERGGSLVFIAAGRDDDHKLLGHPDSLGTIDLYRVSELPNVCSPPTANTPPNNFDVFTRTFAEHYISFERKGQDWNAAVVENRAKVTPQTTARQLFEILSGMIRPLADIHTGIESSQLKRSFDPPLRPGTDRNVRGGMDRFAQKGRRELFEAVDRTYLRDRLRTLCNGQMQYARVSSGVGYLRILSFYNYARHGGLKAGLAALDAALDEIFADVALKGLIIDVRLSFGGADEYSLAIASRLTDREYLAYGSQARSDSVQRDHWTTVQRTVVHPSSRTRFVGPVVELIGGITMSAAEDFTMALMERLPSVTRIGENTQGVVSDALDRKLPNGWSFSVPNGVYRTADGKAFDATGIPPDINVPVFADEDVAAGRDPVMEAALKILLSHEP